MLEDVLRTWGASEVDALTVYGDLFRIGSGEIQRNGETGSGLKSNPLGYWKSTTAEKGHYRILFDDTFPETLKELQDADFAILNGLTYFGRRNTQDAANKMYGLIFDLDGVEDRNLNNFLSGAVRAKAYPVPNYIALSGHGVHLYYVFAEPLPLYPNIKLQLKTLKYALTDRMWNRYTSTLKDVQHQGINQGFRVIGGRTKIDGVRVRAFRLNRQRFTLDQLGEFVPEDQRVDPLKIWKESRLTLAQARKLYPDWYERVVIGGEKLTGSWTCKRDLYDWWLRKIRIGAAFHHRYFCIMCLAIYAVKSGIEREELERDAAELIPFMNELQPDEPFTAADVESALECYDERYVRFPIRDIVQLSNIQIQKNKRYSGRQHLTRERNMQLRVIREREIKYPDGEWRNVHGRPSKQLMVIAWQAEHPEGTPAQCAAELEISRTTVYKYWF